MGPLAYPETFMPVIYLGRHTAKKFLEIWAEPPASIKTFLSAINMLKIYIPKILIEIWVDSPASI